MWIGHVRRVLITGGKINFDLSATFCTEEGAVTDAIYLRFTHKTDFERMSALKRELDDIDGQNKAYSYWHPFQFHFNLTTGELRAVYGATVAVDIFPAVTSVSLLQTYVRVPFARYAARFKDLDRRYLTGRCHGCSRLESIVEFVNFFVGFLSSHHYDYVFKYSTARARRERPWVPPGRLTVVARRVLGRVFRRHRSFFHVGLKNEKREALADWDMRVVPIGQYNNAINFVTVTFAAFDPATGRVNYMAAVKPPEGTSTTTELLGSATLTRKSRKTMPQVFKRSPILPNGAAFEIAIPSKGGGVEVRLKPTSKGKMVQTSADSF